MDPQVSSFATLKLIVRELLARKPFNNRQTRVIVRVPRADDFVLHRVFRELGFRLIPGELGDTTDMMAYFSGYPYIHGKSHPTKDPFMLLNEKYVEIVTWCREKIAGSVVHETIDELIMKFNLVSEAEYRFLIRVMARYGLFLPGIRPHLDIFVTEITSHDGLMQWQEPLQNIEEQTQVIRRRQRRALKIFNELYWKEHARVFLARVGSTAVGFTEVEVSDRRVFINRLVVSPFERGKRVGSALIDNLKKTFPHHALIIDVPAKERNLTGFLLKKDFQFIEGGGRKMVRMVYDPNVMMKDRALAPAIPPVSLFSWWWGPLAALALLFFGSARAEEPQRSPVPKTIPARVILQNAPAALLQGTVDSLDVNSIDGWRAGTVQDIIDRPRESRDTVILLNEFMLGLLKKDGGALYASLKNEKREKGGRIFFIRENENLSFGAAVGLNEFTRAVSAARGVSPASAFVNAEVWAPRGFRLVNDGGDARALEEILCTVFESETRAFVGYLKSLLSAEAAVKQAA
jgi:GNAT superfamily N-acetyltransferase